MCYSRRWILLAADNHYCFEDPALSTGIRKGQARPMDQLGVYPRLPIPLQNLFCSLAGWKLRRMRFAGEYPRLLGEAKARTFLPAAELLRYRDERLRRFVDHAVATTPYYRDLFARLRLNPSDIRSLADLEQLPILSKAEIQSRPLDFQSQAPGDRTYPSHTSGSTGAGLTFRITRASLREQWAIWWRYWSWHGLTPGVWSALFTGRSIVPLEQQHAPFWRINRPGRQILFSGYHMSETTLPAYIDELERRHPPWIVGYPSLLAAVAEHLVSHGRKLNYQVRWVSTASENLQPHQQMLIRAAFGVSPFQHYGNSEAVASFAECPAGRLHVDEDFSAVEFVPSADYGGGCRVVGTNFSNPATPLLRYEVQDMATPSDELCSCGRASRVVATVDGRQEDYVVLANGARLGRLDHAFKDLDRIREAQIHQARPGAITVRVVRSPEYTEVDERRLRAELAQRLGDSTEIAVEYHEKLPRTAAGKLRFVVSDLRSGRQP